MAVPLLDLHRQYAALKQQIDDAVARVFAHQQFILGPEVKECEKQIAALCGVKYAIGVASGTDALLIALRSAGVQPGDEVIVPDFSFFATAGVVARLCAKPVFVDIDPESYNIDPARIEAAITDKTKAIIPVHLFGQAADMDAIMAIARKHKLTVIEDAAQAIGAEYNGHPVGSLGDMGCFSFFPSKNLGGAGDGGMIVTDSEEHYERCVMLRTHGEKPKYHHRMVGYNSRLDTLQAAVLLAKLPHLRGWSEQRQKHARRYDDAFAAVEALTTPKVKPYATFPIYNQYTLASAKREQILAALKEAQIGHAVYYPVPFHQQDCFRELGFTDADLPVATQVAQQVFSIPVFPELTDDEQNDVITTITTAAAG